MHILLVEPDNLLAATYQASLESAARTVAWARTAQQAVFKADEHRPDVIVLEPQMARHNGIEFLYEFKSYPEWQDIPVIILSVLPASELGSLPVLQRELSVVAILSKTHTTLDALGEAVNDVVKAQT